MRLDSRTAQRWHALTAAVAVTALVLQLVLIVIGNPVLDEVEPPGLAMRVYRFFAYFTIQSNLLVAVAAVTLARDPARDGPTWRVVRLAGIVGIAITAVVHFFLLRPLLDLEGWDWAADKLLHMVVPALAVVGWLAVGPRPRVTSRVVWLALLFPLTWAAWTLSFGAFDGWYPYPFLDPDEEGWAAVLVAVVGITGMFLAFFGAAAWWDRRSPARPEVP
ncbi:Pr6Pr family membrane protein [Nocardioides sp.]|uniref:Pr6Pr family membrane protein n=1 Tax=Nocardioides sp. TaxID=35761 RepID=UPI00286B287E|nr:Pr6Pr family membrane protein [Nocardioides sp.]